MPVQNLTVSMSAFLALSFAALAAALPANISTILPRTDAPFGNKKGLAFEQWHSDILPVLSRDGSATWAYNWQGAIDAPQYQAIPMCKTRGCDPNPILDKIGRGDTPWVLGYNEPDETTDHGGVNLSPQAAYDSWGNDMFKFRDRGAKLVCPGISSYDTPTGNAGYAAGFTWLRQFALTKNNPGEFRCDAQAIHWYGENGKSGSQQADLFIDYVGRAHGIVNDIFRRDMDLWITEFSPIPTGNVDLCKLLPIY